MKTREEVEALKQNWLKDPHWDLEDTVGYEEHAVELAAFASEHNSEWSAAQEKRAAEEYRDTPASFATLRDVFASHALASMGHTMAFYGQEPATLAKVAITAYATADAMMAARKVQP